MAGLATVDSAERVSEDGATKAEKESIDHKAHGIDDSVTRNVHVVVGSTVVITAN